ncbi:MAG: GAF domain-containing protein, partial [Treponemataceae bacterium]
MFLAEIRDTASKFAATISQILDVDVMIIDRTYVRVADTFRYVNDPPALRDDSVTGRAITSGKVIVVSDKQKFEVCKSCSDLVECCIAQIIAVPIFYEETVVGAIDLLVPFGKQSPVFENLELSIDFLERMADLLSSKLRNIDDYNKLDVIKKEREILLDFIEEALVYTNEMGEIIHWNNQFAKLFNVDSANVGRRIDKVLDHPMILGAVLNPRSFSNQEFNYSDRNVGFRG